MHWVLQANIFTEWGMNELVRILLRDRITFSVHTVIPFVGDIVPDINPEGPVMVVGSQSLRHVAKKKGWSPGVFSLEGINYQDMIHNWGRTMLNYDAKFCRFDSVEFPSETFFVKPDGDVKLFAGTLTNKQDFQQWQKRVLQLGEDDGSTIRADTPLVISTPKRTLKELRFWIVDGEVATQSQYKLLDKVVHAPSDDEEATKFVERRLSQWLPAKTFVIDVALVDEEGEYKVVEINTLNCSGLYRADIESLVYALEKAYDFKT